VIFNAVTGAPEDIVGVNTSTIISRTFSTVGTFPYQCTIHSGMTGSVVVQ
jgi:plastocyanin